MAQKPRVTACPTCRREVVWGDEFPYRPFCSERCRMVDLGAWFTGGRSIPGQEPPLTPDDDDKG